ncbi:MAG: GNAT family N-acetyltransferase [Planctomycetota bacterium]
MSIPTPATDRLEFRVPTIKDAETLHQVFDDDEVMRYIGDGSRWSLDAVESRLARGAALVDDGKPYFWTVARRDTGEIIGQGGIVGIEFAGPEIELGYRLGRAHWGRGFASEIAQAAVDTAFAPVDRGGFSLDRLVAVCFPENTPSRRVLAKTGFVELGMTDSYYGVECLLHEQLRADA